MGDFNRQGLTNIEQTYGLTARVTFRTRENAILDQILSNAQDYDAPTKRTPLYQVIVVLWYFFRRTNLPKQTIRKAFVVDRRVKYV